MRLGLRFVLLHHGFDLLPRIAAGIDQILIRFVQFVLVQGQLRLRQVQFVLHGGFLRILGLRELGGEVIHPLLIGGQQFLRFADPRLDRGGIGVQCGRVSFRIANPLLEGKIELVIRNAQCRLSKRLLIRGNGALRKPQCRFISGLVHEVSGRNGRDAFFPTSRVGAVFHQPMAAAINNSARMVQQDFIDVNRFMRFINANCRPLRARLG